MSQSPIRVLQVIADFKKGGVQAEVMYPARLLSQNDVRFDAMLLSDVEGYYEEEFKEYGEIFRIPIKKQPTKIQRFFSVFINYFFIKREMYAFFSSHNKYDAVHVRNLLYNAPVILAAKKAGVPVRIAHCAVNRPKGKYKDRLYIRLYLKYCAHILRKYATKIFGVTASAVEYIAGEGNGIVIKNPTISLDCFNPALYPNRNNNGIIRLIMVGSFSYRKNQKFTIDVLNELYKIKADCSLTLIGYRRNEKETYLDEIKDRIKRYGLVDKVTFLPQDTDIPFAMSESTALMMPSVQEGLPNVALEAQAMGLPCFISTDVSTECDCGLCRFLPLKEGAKYWAETIVDYVNQNGFTKHYPDMSEWDNKRICEEYLDYWRGKI